MCEPQYSRQFEFTIRLKQRPLIIESEIFGKFSDVFFRKKSAERNELFFKNRLIYIKGLFL